jgi:L-serine deaminase
MVRTQIQLTEEQARRVRRIARQEGVSMAEIIRRCVDRGLEESKPSRTELWERALALAGRFEDPAGAEDVSERHDDYLDGIYG